jgi:hypothetical protein
MTVSPLDVVIGVSTGAPVVDGVSVEVFGASASDDDPPHKNGIGNQPLGQLDNI